MAARPDVQVASPAIAAVDTLGLAGAFAQAALRIPLRAPWRGPSSMSRNIAVASTRELLRSLMGYMTSLPVDEFRAIERVLDEISRAVLPPLVTAQGITMTSGEVGGVEGLWFRPRRQAAAGTIVYLHGGGFIGTSPSMYSLFMAYLSRVTRCEVFVADYRLAPEFPYPAATDDATRVIGALVDDGVPMDRLILAGDSGGGGLAGSVLGSCAMHRLGTPAAVVLFSPEVSFVLDQPSMRDNAELDILPWNIPTNPYLNGADPVAASMLSADLDDWPPTFVAYGEDEVFRDAIREFVVNLDKAGVEHEAVEAPGMFHAYPFLLPWAKESHDTYRQVAAFVRRHCGS